jgi:CBS domain containing-hemolysin-like protein
MLQLAVLIIGFIILSGLLAMLDAAFLSVSRAEVEETFVHDLWGGHALKGITQRQMRTLIVIIILTNVVNILGPILIGIRTAFLFGNQGIGILTAFLTALTILFSEIIPKAVGTRHAPTISRFAAPVLLLIVIVLTPFLAAIEMLVRPFRKGDRPTGTEEQVRALVRIGEEQGFIEEGERKMIHRTFRLTDRTSADVMVPRDRIISIPASATIREAAAIAGKHPHYRYPVCGGTLDDVRGFVLARDVLQALVEGDGDAPVTGILRDPLSVPASMGADDVLELLRKRRLHLALVRDPGGKVIGAVTLHDILEELVGTIEDEEQRRE